jgi:hypothetical protein
MTSPNDCKLLEELKEESGLGAEFMEEKRKWVRINRPRTYHL